MGIINKQHVAWLQEAGWKRARIDGGVVLRRDLGDRLLTIYPSFADIAMGVLDIPPMFVFRDGGQLSFPFQLNIAKWIEPELGTIGMVRRHNTQFETTIGSAEFIRECTDEIIAWAKGIDLEVEVRKLADIEYEDYNHLTALAALGEAERLRALYERQRDRDPDAPYLHGTLLPSIKLEAIARAVEVAEYYRQQPMDWNAPAAPSFCELAKQTRKTNG